MKLFSTRFHLPIAFLLMSAHLCAQAHGPVLKSKPHSRPAFVSSNFFWSWYENGLTTFTFSLKNQTGHDVKNVNYRVLFFDRQGTAEASTRRPQPVRKPRPSTCQLG